jgi:hypothetical protein
MMPHFVGHFPVEGFLPEEGAEFADEFHDFARELRESDPNETKAFDHG